MDIGEVSVLKSLFDLLNIIYNLTIKLIFHAVIMKVVYNYVINKAAAFSYKNIFKIIRDCFKYIWRLAGYKILFYIILGGTLLFSVIGAGISFPFITAITVPVSFFLSGDLIVLLASIILTIVGPVLVLLPTGFIWI
jgi:hypothetical protein